jgi:cytochrome c oxidase subunit IV
MEHISPTRTYIGVWIALMCLTVLTAGVSRIDLGPFNTVVALAIATCKGLLVVLFFMHVKYISVRTTWVVIVAGFFWLLILLMLSLTDYLSRPWR